MTRFPALPASVPDVREWLARHVPEMLEAATDSSHSLIEKATKQLMEKQDNEIKETTKQNSELTQVRNLIAGFLTDCTRSGLDPTIDIGQLRRDRWKQWKRIPAEYRQNPPLRSFKTTPGYIFEVHVAQYKDELCAGLDGSLYKHQLNALDPYPIEELVKSASVEKIEEGLIASLVWLLKAKQTPQGPSAVPEDPADSVFIAGPVPIDTEKIGPNEPISETNEEPDDFAPAPSGGTKA